MQVRAWMCAGVLALCCGTGVGQMGGAQSSAAIGSPMDPAKAQDALLSMFEQELMGVVNAMPADKFSFAPASGAIPGAKFDGVRTFAQQCTHLAQANYFFFMSFGGPKPSVDLKTMGALTSKAEIVSALQGSFAYAHQAVATITPGNAYETIKGVDGMQTRATVASFAVAHGFDHYGQMVEYLRMNGVVPPGSK